MAFKRKRMSRGKSRRNFRRGSKTKSKNLMSVIRRGGYRM